MSTSADGGTPRPALISVRQTTAESKWAGASCPKCNNPIQAGEAAVLCPKCYTPHHLTCWNENDKRCAIDQTPANVLDRTARAGAAPAPAAAAGAAPAAPPRPTGDGGTPRAPAPTPAEAGVVTTAEAAQPAVATATAPATRAAAAVSQTAGTAAARPAASAPPAASTPTARPPARPATPAPAAAGRTMSIAERMSAVRRSQAQLTVWPHLLMSEFLASVLLLIGLTVMSWFINAPLEEHSNPNRTPNPSKAPWYFLNLQELLLHMHPALAGVIIPTLAIILLMAIPYLDITTDEIGVWFSGPRGLRVFWISTIYTSVATIGLIMIDKFVGIRALVENLIPFFKTAWISEIVTQTMLPTTILWVVSLGLYALIAHMRPTVREVMIAYFTAFAVSWVLMALIGSAFRGPAQELYWPWAMPPRTA